MPKRTQEAPPEEEQVETTEDQVEEEVDSGDEEEPESPTAEDEEEAAQPPTKASPFGVWSTQTASRKKLKVLLYGPSGAGKTRYAATFPDPLFLDLEGGLRSTLQVGSVLRFPADPSEEIEEFDQVKQFYTLVKKEKNPQFKTIVIDSLNELQVLVVKEVLAEYDANRMYDDQMNLQDYGKMNRLFLDVARAFLKLPYHIVFTAVETPREYEGQEVYPKFTGKQIWPELQRMMEQIGYCHVRRGDGNEPEHVVAYRLHPSYVAKTRLKINRPYLPNDFSELEKYIPKEII